MSQPVQAETLDRVVASIGHQAITQRDIADEYHFEQFLQGKVPKGPPDPSLRKIVLSRLISQKLLARQIGSSSRETATSKETAENTLKNVRKEFASDQAYRSALQTLGMTEPQVIERLQLYQRTLRMIDERLRPTAWPNQQEIENYYKMTFVPEYAKGHTTSPPSLAEVHDEIQEILVQQKMNQLLSNWLDRLKSSSRVTIHEDGSPKEKE